MPSNDKRNREPRAKLPNTPLDTRPPAPPSGLERGLKWLAKALIGVPRVVRIWVAAFLSIAVTFATFPIMSAISLGITGLTQNLNVYLTYVFTADPAVSRVLVGISLVIGLVYYILGWRFYVGTSGEAPTAGWATLAYFTPGVLAVIITAVWLTQGVLALSTPL
jgi:hypothetical protein